MNIRYDEGRHLHLGYYEKGHDIEGMALKVKGKDEWHVCSSTSGSTACKYQSD